MVQRVPHGWVERLWQRHRSTGLMPFAKPSGRPAKPITSEETTVVLAAYDGYEVNALPLERALLQTYGVRASHNRVHRILTEDARPGPGGAPEGWEAEVGAVRAGARPRPLAPGLVPDAG